MIVGNSARHAAKTNPADNPDRNSPLDAIFKKRPVPKILARPANSGRAHNFSDCSAHQLITVMAQLIYVMTNPGHFGVYPQGMKICNHLTYRWCHILE